MRKGLKVELARLHAFSLILLGSVDPSVKSTRSSQSKDVDITSGFDSLASHESDRIHFYVQRLFDENRTQLYYPMHRWMCQILAVKALRMHENSSVAWFLAHSLQFRFAVYRCFVAKCCRNVIVSNCHYFLNETKVSISNCQRLAGTRKTWRSECE